VKIFVGYKNPPQSQLNEAENEIKTISSISCNEHYSYLYYKVILLQAI